MGLPSNFFSTQSVLVIDDIETIRSAIKGMLQMFGCVDISVAVNGNRALELCEHKKFDFILCDFNLGKGKDGYQLFEELKLRELLKSNTVFIMVSAETTLQVVHGLVELQPDDYLLKPFTYKKLETRLIRALEKRKVLGGIYDALAMRDYKKSLAECAKASKKSSKYMLPIMRFKGEVLLNLDQPKLALELYDLILSHRELSWAKLGKAIAYYHLADYANSETLLAELCGLKETRIEALNWLASIYLQRHSYSQAKDILNESVKLSPKNIPRQRALANISLLEGDSDTAIRSFKSVLNNTRFSVHEHIDHHFNYIHCLLDHAPKSNQLQQAKIFSQIQPILKNASQRFDKALCQELEKVVTSRILLIKEELKAAVKSLDSCDVDVILGCGPDSSLALANTWFDSGDHEKYTEIINAISFPEESNKIENMSGHQLVKTVCLAHEKEITKLLNLNEQGIKLYRNGLYSAATVVFIEAHEIMANNSQLALNLAQSALKGWPTTETFSKKKAIVKECIRVIEAVPLNGMSKQRYKVIEKQLKAI